MKQNVLRGPLVKSAVVLVVFSLLFYFTSSTPGGSVWASIGTLCIALFKTVQWAVGMAIGLTVSLVVLVGIFLGAVALADPASASRMYEGLRRTVISWFAPLLGLFKSDRGEKAAAALDSMGQDLKNQFTADLQGLQAGLRRNQAELDSKMAGLTSRLSTLEETAATLAPAEQVDVLAEEIKSAVDAAAELQGTVTALKSSVDQAAKQVEAVSGEAILGDVPARLEALEQQEFPEIPSPVDLSPLEKEIAVLRTEITVVRKQVAEAAVPVAAKKAAAKPAEKAKKQAAPAAGKEQPAAKTEPKVKAKSEQPEEHRIFSYFESAADKKKVADVVQSTLKKDMSYKQVMELLAKNLGGKKGAIITSHPSLSKDYIRLCRRNS